MPKGTLSTGSFRLGGGLNLKDLNKKDTLTQNVNVVLQANQTTKMNMEQAIIIANYYKRNNGLFIGASTVGCASTQFGILAPTLYFNAGLDFETFQIEYRVGSFKRSNLLSSNIGPQNENNYILLGEGAGSSNSMALIVKRGNTSFGFGHQGVQNFYDLSQGKYFGYFQTSPYKWISISGGVDFTKNPTGFGAIKVISSNNSLVVTANNLGTECESFIATYNRTNIPVGSKKASVAVSGWHKKTEQGVTLVSGLNLGRGNLFAELGSVVNDGKFSPYCGVGTSLCF